MDLARSGFASLPTALAGAVLVMGLAIGVLLVIRSRKRGGR